MKNGNIVSEFEKVFADYVGAEYAIALCNGTATLHTALKACGHTMQSVAVPPLTMSATSLAVLHAGGAPHYWDVDPRTWIWNNDIYPRIDNDFLIPVSLFGLRRPDYYDIAHYQYVIDDAAQTLRQHAPGANFTSYSFQASKILSLGEGGMLTTNDQDMARKAREFSSLGYRMYATQARIDPATLKSPDALRHFSIGFNYRMNDFTAAAGLVKMRTHPHLAALTIDCLRYDRQCAAERYMAAIAECTWIKAQHVPDGWAHDYWCFPVAVFSRALRDELVDRVTQAGAEMPYGAWALSYNEPALKAHERLDVVNFCPHAESVQPRLIQFQTNDAEAAQRNAIALSMVIDEMGRRR